MNSSRHFAGIGVQVAWAEPASSDRSSGLTTARSQRLDEAVERALQWLAGQQQRDGSFPAMPNGQPGVTSLAALAFLSAGHLPESEPYGSHLHRAIDYVLSCEREAGLLNAAKPGQRWEFDAPSHTGYYNHAIAGLMLSESSGQLQGQRSEKVVAAIERALGFTTKKQLLEIAGRPQDEGGWRYPVPHPTDSFKSDLSITAWQLTFLRSAANAGFDVKSGTIDAAEKYVKGLYKEKKKNFTYDHRRVTRGVTGAGIMAMAMLGQHGSKEALAAANWIKRHPFKSYGERVGQLDRFHYSVYYCTQGMYQIGGKDFREFFPHVVDLLVQNQRPDGSWPAVDYERRFGDAYVTAMSVLALTTHYGLLPIHQR
jgi:hypothetical protein